MFVPVQSICYILTATMLVLSLHSFGQVQKKGVDPQIPVKGVTGKLYALVVGVSDYEKDLIRDLKYASADARAMTDYLTSAPIEKGLIISLFDREAKRSAIKEKGIDQIDDLVFSRKITEDDVIIVYLSGHGGAFSTKDSFFFPYDAEHTTDAGSSFSIKRLKNKMDEWTNETGATVIFIFDACRSSTLATDKDLDLQSAYNELERSTGEILLAASQGGEPAQERSDLKHGVFSFYLLGGLYGKADTNKDRWISTGEISNYINQNVYSLTEQQQQPFTRYPTGFQKKNIFPVDEKLYASADSKLKLDLSNPDVVLLASKGSGGTEQAAKLSDLITKFEDAMKDQRLVTPTANCASFYFQQMAKMVPETSLDTYRRSLAIALYDAALFVVKGDLNGERGYLMMSNAAPGMSTKQYNVHFYERALNCIAEYVKLKKGRVDPSTFAIKEYLMGRQATIEFLDDGKHEKIVNAIGTMSAATRKYPDEAFLWQGLAMALTEDKVVDRKEVIDAASKAHALAPTWSYPLITIGESYEAVDAIKSEAYYRQAIETNPRDFTSYVLLGDLAFDRNEFEKQLGHYLKALQIGAQSPSIMMKVAKAYYFHGQYDSATLYLERVRSLRPQDGQVFYYLGNVNIMLGNFEEAKQLLEQAVEDPYYGNLAKTDLAEALSHTGENDRAVTLLNSVLKEHPSPYTYYRLAQVHATKGNYAGAEDSYNKALALSSDSPYLYLALSSFYKSIGDMERAEATYRKYIERWPADPVPYADLAMVAAERGEDAKAISWMDEAISLTKDSDNPQQYYNQYGDMLTMLGKHTEAIKKYEYYLEKHPDDFWANYSLGTAYLATNQLGEALNAFKRCNEIDASSGWVYYYIGKIQKAMKSESSNASTNLSRAIELAGEDTALKAWANFENEKFQLAEQLFERHIEANPNDANAYYDFACFLSLRGRVTESLAQLETALQKGFKDWVYMKRDPDLNNIKNSPAFDSLIQKYNKEG